MSDKIELPYGCFQADDGRIGLVRCFKCGSENYAPNVLTGICSWCGMDVHKHLASSKRIKESKEKANENHTSTK